MRQSKSNSPPTHTDAVMALPGVAETVDFDHIKRGYYSIKTLNPSVKAARENWVEGQDDLDPEHLIFIDESGLSTKMARLRGWAPKGERCCAAIPHGHWKTVTFVGGLTLTGFVAPMLLDGPMDGECFLAWVEQMLVPTLRAGDIVVMDNLAGTRSPASGKLSRPVTPNSAICRPTVRTSIRSKTPSPSSRRT